MALPKKVKNSLPLIPEKVGRERRQEMLDDITDYGTELSGYPQDFGRGTNTATDTDVYWNNGYDYIREVNILLEDYLLFF